MMHRYYFFFDYIFFIVDDLKRNEIYNIVVFMDNSIMSAVIIDISAQAVCRRHFRSHSRARREAWPIAISHAAAGVS